MIGNSNENRSQQSSTKGLDSQLFYEAREETKLTLRKKKLADKMRTKRQLLNEPIIEEAKQFEIVRENLKLSKEILEKHFDSIKNLVATCKMFFNSSYIDEVKYGVLLIRKYCTLDKSPIPELYNEGIVDLIFTTMKKYINDNSIIYESLWVLVNISFIIDNSDLIYYLLSDSCFYVWEQILKMNCLSTACNLVWVLAHLAMHNPNACHIIMTKPFFKSSLIPLLQKPNMNKQILAFGFGILVKDLPYLTELSHHDQFKDIYEPLTQLFCDYHELDYDCIKHDCLVGLASLSNINNHNIIMSIFICGIIRRIVTYALKYDINDEKYTIQLIGNFLNYIDESLIDRQFNKEIVQYIKRCIQTSKEVEIRKDALWVLGNICAGTSSQLKDVLEEGLFPLIMVIGKDDFEPANVEAIVCLSIILTSGNTDNILHYGFNQIIPLLVEIMIKNINIIGKKPIIMPLLECFSGLFEIGKRIQEATDYRNFFLDEFEKNGGKDLLESLFASNDNNIVRMVENIIKQYYHSNL